MRFFLRTVAVFLGTVLVIVAITALLGGLSELTKSLGGSQGIGTLFGVVVGVLVLAAGIWYLQSHDYTDQRTRRVIELVVAIAIVVILAIVGLKWVDAPNEIGVRVLAAALLLIGWSALGAYLTRSRPDQESD